MTVRHYFLLTLHTYDVHRILPTSLVIVSVHVPKGVCTQFNLGISSNYTGYPHKAALSWDFLDVWLLGELSR